MKKYSLSILVIFLFATLSCTKDDSANDTVKILGIILSNTKTPEENVTVSIGDFKNLTTTTNSEGFFQIEGVAKGEHDLKIYKKEDETDADVFVQRTIKVAVNADTDLERLTLPNPVVLEIPTEITASSALITWNKSVSGNFREYKLYRHSSSGLDETTGTLVHVATDSDESTFLDEDLNNAETYYYRVFVLDEFGQIGGSNIISFETSEVLILKNGSFEDVIDGQPLEWNLVPNDLYTDENTIEIDDTQSTQGNRSIKFQNADSGGCYEQWIDQTVENSIVVEGATYRLSFDYKSDFNKGNTGSEASLIVRNSSDLDEWFYMNVDFRDDGEWRNHSYEFTLPAQFSPNNVKMTIHFCTIPTGTWWLDDISIERIN